MFPVKPSLYLFVVDVDLHDWVDVQNGSVGAEALSLESQILVGIEVGDVRFRQDDVVDVGSHICNKRSEPTTSKIVSMSCTVVAVD